VLDQEPWHVLSVPAIAGIDEDHLMDDRKVGDILPERENANPWPTPGELPLNLGDGVNQAANLASGMTSIPSRNLTPLMTFGNWF
jgi:hypothetical protein